MNVNGEYRRRLFLDAGVAALAALLLGKSLNAQAEGARRQRDSGSAEPAEDPSAAATGRKAVLEENDKDIKKKIAKLFQLASELKEEADKTDSVKVLSLAMVRKAEEIERLAKDIKSKAKG